jgi:integrase
MSIHKVVRSNGKRAYKVRWREGGVNRSRQFDRLEDARDWEGKVRRERQTGDIAVLGGGTRKLSEYAGKWWTDYAEQNLAPRTLEVYAVQLDLRITPALGGYRLREITPALVQEFIAKLRRKGVGDPSIVKTATVLQSILNRAYVDGMISRNPVSVVRKPSQRRTREPDTVPPTTIELIRAAMQIRDATLVSVLAYAGLRPESEAIALRWKQVGKRTLDVPATKTGNKRHVRLLAPLASDLELWRKSCGEPPGASLVFPASRGTWSRDDWRNWLRRVYRPAAMRAGLDKTTRPRDLRGSFASLLIYEGRNVVEVAEQLGHSAYTCLRDYAGVFAEYHPDDRVSAEGAIERAREAVGSA